MNIIRGRDHGLPGYIEFVKACGGPRIGNFRDLRSLITQTQVDRLEKVYETPADIDLSLARYLSFV